MRHVAEINAEEQDERVETAPPPGRSAGDTLIDHVPYDHLYRALVTQVCQQIELIFGDGYGRQLLAGILENLPRRSDAENDETRPIIARLRQGDIRVLEEEWDFFFWDEVAGDFTSLFVFARHGEGPGQTPVDSRTQVEALLAHFRRFVAHRGIQAALAEGFEWFADTLAAAEARWAIDHGQAVTADALAALAGVKSKTIANLLAARQLPVEADGRISAAEARRYLERRKDFVRSTWQDPPAADEMPEPIVAPTSLPEQVFVPVDGEGNAFLPSLARRGRDGRDGRLRYAIGEKAAPEYVEDYWQALDRLARMPTPRWRRPNPSGAGGWGLVSAQDGWRRLSRADLERMVRATHEA